MTILDLGRRGVVGLVRAQLIGTLAGIAFAAIGLVMASPLAGMLSQLEPIAFTVRLASVSILATVASIETRPSVAWHRSGWPREGVLLFGASVIFTVAISSTFACLSIISGANEAVQQTFAVMLVLGNAFLGAVALLSYMQREPG